MDYKIIDVSEVTDIDQNGRFVRSKRVRFTVNKSEHTLRISMPDFEAGKTKAIVEREAKKILDVYG
jgi:hypothetical protein